MHGVAEPQLHAGRKPSPQPVLSVWLLHLTTGTVDGLAGVGFVSTYFANGGCQWGRGILAGPVPNPFIPDSNDSLSGKLQHIAPCGNHSNDNPAGLYIFRLVLGNNDK